MMIGLNPEFIFPCLSRHPFQDEVQVIGPFKGDAASIGSPGGISTANQSWSGSSASSGGLIEPVMDSRGLRGVAVSRRLLAQPLGL